MRKHLLSAALLACLCASFVPNSSEAVSLNPRGTGQVLIYPYYTVNGGNQTLVSVVNTNDIGKALKVRFLEGRNGREDLTFNLYLGPYDTWTAAVFELSADGPANLSTSDKSCTVPAIRTSTALPQLGTDGARYVPFRNFAYAAANGDSGPNTQARTREGSIEIIEMGTLLAGSPSASAATAGSLLGVPLNCAQLVAAWTAGQTPGYWLQNPLLDIGPPDGGLFGNLALVDVANGTMLAAAADAIDGFRVTALHGEPANSSPSLRDALTDVANDLAVAYVPVGAQTLRSEFRASTNGIDAVSAVLMADTLWNEFNTETVVGAQSEWVVSFPTKRYYTDQALVGATALAPFQRVFPTAGATGQACVDVHLLLANRDATRTELPPPLVGVPPPDSYPTLCYHSQVLRFGASNGSQSPTSEILGASLVSNVPFIDPSFRTGYLRLNLRNYNGNAYAMRASLDGDIYRGLPVSGFAAVNYINANVLPGILANFSAAVPHRSRASCVNVDGVCQ